MTAYDAIVIGTGQAGPSLAKRLAGAGMRVAIVERGAFGGTCINAGCTPTKTMIASAYTAHLARRGAEFGVVLPGAVRIDMQRVKARKDEIVHAWSAASEASLRATPGCDVYRGHARFQTAHDVTIGSELLSAPQIFVNVGGRAFVPSIPGLNEVSYLTNSSILDLDLVPRHLVVIGGSYVGLEFAHMHRRFGAEVTVIESGPRLIQHEDEDISSAVRSLLESEGIHFLTGVRDLRLVAEGSGFRLTLANSGGEMELQGSHLLLAVGRRPNTDDLGLERAGVAVDNRGYIQVNDRLETSAPGIWALGECNGRGAFTHTAYNDFEIVAANLLGGEPRSVRDRIPAYALYTDPPLGRAGMTEAEARGRGRANPGWPHGDGRRSASDRKGRDRGPDEDRRGCREQADTWGCHFWHRRR